MRAAKSLDLATMDLLLKAGANPSLGMTNGSNPLLLVAATRAGAGTADKALRAVEALAQRGADVKAANVRGETALHAAARQGSNAVVRKLAELGADLDAKDKSGKTALDLVTQPGVAHHDDTAALLKELAAERNK
jgi:ankyrin repeat protein